MSTIKGENIKKRGRPKGSKTRPIEVRLKEKELRKSRKGGGQPGNKNAEKWTEEKAMELANAMLEWMRPKWERDEKSGKMKDRHSGHIYFNRFLYIENDYPHDVLDYLEGKFYSFSATLKKLKKIQEVKLWELTTFSRGLGGGPIFALKAIHGHRESSHIDMNAKIDATIKQKNYDLSKLSTEQLRKFKAMVKLMEKKEEKKDDS
jgi:Holliday junction resolvase